VTALSPVARLAPTTRLDETLPAPQAEQATLLISDSGQVVSVLLESRVLRLGRANDNDIVLASRFVSGYHARIEPEGNTHQITDLGSTNGLLSEGHRLAPNTPLTLADGDVLRIGDPTTGNYVTLTYRNPKVRRASQASRVVQSYKLDPNDPQITIGRKGNNIVLDNPQVSRQHAVIGRSDAGHSLTDVGSMNGTFVNGKRITQHTLVRGDIIQIGPFKLLYNGTSLDQYDQRGALRLDARALTRSVPQGNTQRVILRDVSLSIAPREFVALVGGSGTGKSTLLKALAGYIPADRGRVFVNGDDFYANFAAYRTLLGYVPQDDIVHAALPLERALEYAAELRLPDDTATEELNRRINTVLDDVEMQPHRTTIVERLSGGQRKRSSIGVELLADPSLFFLDEATSGLDPGLEKKLMYTLRRLADSGRTVVLVTHATANIYQCDLVGFMAEGRLVYFGPPHEALTFFNVSSGDFADIYSKLDGPANPLDTERWAVVRRDLQTEYDSYTKATPGQVPTLAELWEMKFRASEWHRGYVAERLAHAPQQAIATGSLPTASGRPARVSLLRQFGVLVRRTVDLIVQDRRNLAILLLQAPLIGLLLVLVADAGAMVGPDATITDARRILFVLATVAVWFGIINAAREIAKETAIYRRERLASLRIGPYIASKFGVLSLLVLVQSAILLGFTALKVTLPAWGVLLPAWIELYITTVLAAEAGLALGLVISAVARTPDRAISLVPLLLIPQILFAGVIFSLGEGATIQRMLSWLTISRWTMDAYGTTANLNELPLQPGFLQLATGFSEYTFTPEHLVSRWIALIIFTVICLLATALLLKRQDGRV
jgi:ABC-type multidrug transport system ATPase subunit